jgi:hypothetical protein
MSYIQNKTTQDQSTDMQPSTKQPVMLVVNEDPLFLRTGESIISRQFIIFKKLWRHQS